jgi:hypothetical protein
MANDDSQPKIHIDSDWKAEAQKEKERLAAKEAESATGSKRDEQGLPEANFQALVSVLASQAIMGLGAYGDPKTGKVMIDLEGSRFSIDLLAVLEEKTKNNLEPDEADQLKQLLNELRNRYVQIAQLVAEQQAKGASGGQAATGGESKPNLEI